MDEEVTGIREFLRDPATFSWWIVIGEAGAGKSRLALELCVEANSDWYVGFLPEAAQEGLIGFEPREPTFIIVDYAAARATWLGRALYDHALRAERYSAPLRILVLERGIDESWYPGAVRLRRHNESQALLSHQYASPLQLSGLSDDDLRLVINDVATARGSVLSSTETEYILDRTLEVDQHRRPLFAIVSTLDSLGATHHLQSRDSLLRAILARRSAQRAEQVPDAVLRERVDELELVATAVGGIEPDRYTSLVAASQATGSLQLPSAFDLQAHRLTRSLLGIQPDILGEIAVLDAMPSTTNPLHQMMKDGLCLAWRFDPQRYAAFAERVARDHPWHPHVGDLLDVQPRPDELDAWFALAPTLVPHMGSSANPAVQRIASLIDELATDGVELSRCSRASLLFHQGNLLLNEGRLDAAISIYTQLVDQAEPEWACHAGSLTNRGVAYLQLERRAEGEADFTSVIESGDASDESRACCFNNRADLRSQAGDAVRSIADRTAVLQLRETTYNRRYIALARRAATLWSLGDIEAAFADLEAVLQQSDIVVEQKLSARLTRAQWRIENDESELAMDDLRRVVGGRRNFPGVAERALSLLAQFGTSLETGRLEEG